MKVQMAVVSVLLIHELLLAQWLKNEKTLEMEDDRYRISLFQRTGAFRSESEPDGKADEERSVILV